MTLLNAGAAPELACNNEPFADEAAVTSNAPVPSPYNTPLSVNEVLPVPPSATARAVPNVNAPDTSKLPFKSTVSFSTILFDPAASSVKLPDTLCNLLA